MLRVMLQKLWHKKWMMICLLIGCVLLTATVVSFPLYRNAAFNRMLQDEFQVDMEDRGSWPAINSMFYTAKHDTGGKAMSMLEDFARTMYDDLGVKEKETLVYTTLSQYDGVSCYDRGDDWGKFSLSLGMMSRIEEHAKALSGEMFSESGRAENGAVEVIISETTMTKQNLLIGENVEFEDILDQDGKPFKIQIVGVFAENDKQDLYWQVKPNDMKDVCIMKEGLFKEIFAGEHAEEYTLRCSYYSLIDYTKLTASDVDHLYKKTNELMDGSYRMVMQKPTYLGVLESYNAKCDRIRATLFILQIPVLVLLGAFLMMISGQMYDMERNEISVIKSRGASGLQIFRLYLYQSTFLSLVGVGLGIPLGVLFCKLLGSADNFLMFNFNRELVIEFTKEAGYYTLAAFAASLLIMTIPAIKHSRVSIVKLKQQKATRKSSFWEKCCLDIIFLAISLYGFYTYSTSSDAMAERVLKGEAMDPLLYFSSSLFILGAGMLMIRLQPLLVRIIYAIGKKWWRPAAYSSFMEIIKNGRKQQFIMIFMVLTISLGMFDATVARTILENARENQSHLDGADLMVREVWRSNIGSASMSVGEFKLQYYEPDFGKYAAISNAQEYTKVVRDDFASINYRASASDPPKKITVSLLGIHTREFGEITSISDSLLKEPYHKYLNDLSQRPDGALVSANFQASFGYKLEDEILCTVADGSTVTLRIVGFFDQWPGYQPATVSLNNENEVVKEQNYWIVSNIGTLQERMGLKPYQVWIKTKKGTDNTAFYKWLTEQKVSLKQYNDRAKNLDKVTTDPLLQGTNGILTMSFIVTIILCAVGYLIYWIMSIRSRELIFGVLRACGLHKGEIFWMLIIEQFFSGIFSIFSGILVGTIASKMFVPILQNAYAGSNQVLPMRLITNVLDLVRLYGVTAIVMVTCLVVLTVLVFKLNITKALKLGEE